MTVLDFPAFFAGLLSALYDWFMILLVTVVQIISWPINTVINLAFPDIAVQLTNMASYLATMLEFFPFIMSFVPSPVRALLIFIIVAEIALLYVFQSTYYVSKLWKLVQTIKFW